MACTGCSPGLATMSPKNIPCARSSRSLNGTKCLRRMCLSLSSVPPRPVSLSASLSPPFFHCSLSHFRQSISLVSMRLYVLWVPVCACSRLSACVCALECMYTCICVGFACSYGYVKHYRRLLIEWGFPLLLLLIWKSARKYFFFRAADFHYLKVCRDHDDSLLVQKNT